MRKQSLGSWPSVFSSEGLFLLQSCLQLCTLWVSQSSMGPILPPSLLQVWLPRARPSEPAAHNSRLRLCFLRKQTLVRREGTWKPMWSKTAKGSARKVEGCTPCVSSLVHDGNSRNYSRMLKSKTWPIDSFCSIRFN